MAELKPCPFCGGKAIRLNAFGFGQWSAECLSCYVETKRYMGSSAIKFMGEIMQTGRKEAIEAWNSRSESEELKFTRDFIHEHGLEFTLTSAWERRKKDGK